MKMVRISSGGQISVPAGVRRRWGTERLIVEDLGDRLVIRPMPDDPVGSARGSLAWPGRVLDDVRDEYRREESPDRG